MRRQGWVDGWIGRKGGVSRRRSGPALGQCPAGRDGEGRRPVSTGMRDERRSREAARLKSIVERQTAGQTRAAGDSTVDTTNNIEYPSHLRVESPGKVPRRRHHLGGGTPRGPRCADMYAARMVRPAFASDVVVAALEAKREPSRCRLLADVRNSEAEGKLSRALELSADGPQPDRRAVWVHRIRSPQERKRVRPPMRPAGGGGRAFFDYRDVEGIHSTFRAIQKSADSVGAPLSPM